MLLPSYSEKPQILLFLDFGILWCCQLAAIGETGTWCTSTNLPLPINQYTAIQSHTLRNHFHMLQHILSTGQ